MLAEIKNRDYQFFKKLQTSNFFSAIDVFFSNKLNPTNENQAIFFAYIFLISRLGFVSLQIEKYSIYPKPQDLNIENEALIPIEDKMYQVIIQKVIEGSKSNLDNALFSDENISINEFLKYPICRFQNFYYLQRNFVFETKIIENLKKLTYSKPDKIFLEEKFSEYLEKEKTLLSDQKKAIVNALKNSISIILGGPGTGKTYVASHLINIFSKALDSSKKRELQIAATSFTGKATFHLKSNIFKQGKNVKIEAKTLHSLLGLKEGKNKFFKTQKIHFDLIIVDESSMIDIKLMAYLLDAIKIGSRIVFIGDPNQLPPIEGGNLFKEISDILLNQSITLKRAHRFENDIILDLAKAIDFENEKNIDDILNHKIDFIDIDNLNAAKNKIFNMAKENFIEPKKEKIEINNVLAKINEFRILSSIKKGSLGVNTLNQEIFSIFYKKAQIKDFLYVPIIITKNNYKLDLYNGQIGIVCYQKTNSGLSHGTAHFYTDGQVKSFSIYYLRFFEYAYAISIHKSQGSEFESAIVIIPETLKSFGKELFYTAVTRVKNQLNLISSRKILFDLIKKRTFKKSALSKRCS